MKDTSSLDALARSAREDGDSWSAARADRVLSSTLRLRERRVGRARAGRRALVAASAAAAIVVILLRGGSAPARGKVEAADLGASTSSSSELAFAGQSSDGGYVRD